MTTHPQGSDRLSEEQRIEEHKLLTSTEQSAQHDYDRAILYLSGGGLAVSIAFVKDILGSNLICRPGLVLAAWICWTASLCSNVLSFFFSIAALRYARDQLDLRNFNVRQPGGWRDKMTGVFNRAAGVLFLGGTTLFIIFVCLNYLGVR